MSNHWMKRLLLILGATALLGACTSQPSGTSPENLAEDRLKVVATTSIVGDVVNAIAGDTAELVVLLPPGLDPHGFEPTPQDIALVSKADLIFANGAGLEAFLDPLLESAGVGDKVIYLSEGISLLEADGEEEHEDGDPHIWTNPNNVLQWVDTIDSALSEASPVDRGIYQANSEAYRQELIALDEWVREQVAQVAQSNRQLVTDHQVFAYFAEEYGFTQVGTLIPGYSTMAEPSAKKLAEIEDAIKALGVKAVFVGHSVNPDLAQRVAEDTGTQLVFVYTGSLSEEGGEAASYLDYIRYNVRTIVAALK